MAIQTNKIVYCPTCGTAQKYSKASSKPKTCSACNGSLALSIPRDNGYNDAPSSAHSDGTALPVY